MITETSAVAFRQNLGEMLNRVQYRHDSILIKKDGKPVAALVDARLFERIRLMQTQFDALCDRLARTFDGVPEEIALAEIEQATTEARRETADAWRAAGRLPPQAAEQTTPGKRSGRKAAAAPPSAKLPASRARKAGEEPKRRARAAR